MPARKRLEAIPRATKIWFMNCNKTLTVMEAFSTVVGAHRRWISLFGSARALRWERLLASDEEAALCEACVREVLQGQVDVIEPAEDPSKGGPDFRCQVGHDSFYVEATCIHLEVVTRHTGLSADFDPKARCRRYGDLTQVIQAECVSKTPQCSNLDAPCLLAIGMFHFHASAICFGEEHVAHVLTSTTGLSMSFNPEVGEMVGPLVPSTDLRWSSVVRPGGTQLVEAARQPISGLLLCGFGCMPWQVNGVLHPDACRPLPREALPRTRFCSLEPGYERGTLRVTWT